MNSLSAIEMTINIQSKSMAQKLFERGIADQVGAQPTDVNNRDGYLASRKAPDYHLGESVYHGRYGAGQVMAHLPDGRLQIRFTGV